MTNSKNTTKGYGHSKALDELDELLEIDWNEDSSVTVNIHATATPSQFERLKTMTPMKKGAAAGSVITIVIGALLEIARQLHWLPF